MNIELQNGGIAISDALADHSRRRLHYVLSHRRDFIHRIVVRLGSTNSRRGRSAMYCLVQVHLADEVAATAVDFGPDMHEAVDRAADRVGGMVIGHLDRRS